MNIDNRFLYSELTCKIIKSAFNVHNKLGCGLLEKVYQNALGWELTLSGFDVSFEKEYKVIYRDKEVGVYFADIVIEDKVILEIKAVANIDEIHRAQLLNYLKISGVKVGLIINFAKSKLTHERLIY